MAKKGREAWAKRAREVARQEKQAQKRERRQARSDSEPEPAMDEATLLEDYARISEQYSASLVSEAEFQEERRRIMTALGMEEEDE